MKNLKHLFLSILGVVLIFTSCQDDDINFGDIVAPTNVTITAEIVGQDAENPNGNGTGFVNFTATADNEISYKFSFGDGTSEIAPSGTIQHRYTDVGVNAFTVVVNAIGTGGIMSSTSMEIEVYSSFSDIEAENFLTGSVNEEDFGSSKTWYWAANIPLHIGLGPVEDDYGGGEFAWPAWWSAIQPFDEEKSCMYSNEFVFTRTADGITFEQTGPAFVPGTFAGTLGIAGDVCHDEAVVSTTGVKNVAFLPSSSKAALEGAYDEVPYRQSSFEIDGGFMGWYAGQVVYDIISISDTELHVRFIEETGGYAWYAKYQTQNPYEIDNFPNLVWSDEFETNGAPNPENWNYNLGAGGWGNQEVQTYTDNAENVIVEDGFLKITAKADGSGGYTSARIKTEDLQEFTYGRVEVRAKLPASQGTWPAIWMLGGDFAEISWPYCGEIDIMEQTGWDKDTSLGTCHWFDNGTMANASYGETTTIENASSEFHVYSLEWTDESVRIFVDGTSFYTLTNNPDLPFYDKDFFFILNVAMGGTLGGTIDPAFTEDTMEVDYIRVYQ